MAYTPTDLANIDAAIASGELTVEQEGRKITYRSVAELRQARAIILQALAATGQVVLTRPRTSLAYRTQE